MKPCSLLFIISIVFLIATGCDKPRESFVTGRSVKIGVIGPITGPDKALGESGLSGVKTALKLQPILYNNSKVELVVEAEFWVEVELVAGVELEFVVDVVEVDIEKEDMHFVEVVVFDLQFVQLALVADMVVDMVVVVAFDLLIVVVQ